MKYKIHASIVAMVVSRITNAVLQMIAQLMKAVPMRASAVRRMIPGKQYQLYQMRISVSYYNG